MNSSDNAGEADNAGNADGARESDDSGNRSARSDQPADNRADSPPGSETQDVNQGPDGFPVADLQLRVSLLKKWFGSSRMWLVTAVCAIVALTLLVMTIGSGGTDITISFEDGFGIKPGDTLRFRGIDVGEVTQVDVNSELDGVIVHVQLQQNAYELARAGSQFWIERPQVGLARISGLETVVGAKYIGVIPGEKTAASQYRFQGIESPPVIREGSSSRITIQFADGHGIATGDVVRHLGIVIGEVTAVTVSEQWDSVTVHVRLAETAANVARAGSQFWIERPEIGLAEIRGLETLIRGPYIDFLPGPADGPLVQHFMGADHAPPATRLSDGLEIVLTSNQQLALKPGVPVTFRGLKVGHVVSVGLASDASSVQARVYIQPDYKSLVRINSQFWSNVGLDADFSVTGIDLKTDSLQSLAVGSIGFATPDNAGRKARTGDRFGCAASLKDEWLDWNPQIAVGEQMLPEGSQRPSPLRSTIRWDRKRLGFTRNGQRQGWLLLLDNGQLLGLPRYLQPDENAIPDTVKLEMSGVEFPWDPSMLETQSGLATYQAAQQLADQVAWPSQNLRRPAAAEDCLIVSDPQSAVVPLSAANIEEVLEDRFLVAPSIAYDPALDGACVISGTDGCLLGFLDLEKGQAAIVLVDRPTN